MASVLSFLPSIDSMGNIMANISVRGVEEGALRRLKQAARRRGVSLNRLIAEMLNTQAGGNSTAPAVEHIDLDQLAGTWSERDVREFRQATAGFEQVDEDLWR